MVSGRKIYFAIIYLKLLVRCLAEFYLEFPTDQHDPIIFDPKKAKKSDRRPELKVRMYLFHCELDLTKPRAQNEEMPLSCLRITKKRVRKLVYETYNFYKVEYPEFLPKRRKPKNPSQKIVSQKIQFIDYLDFELPPTVYVGIRLDVPPHYPMFSPMLDAKSYYKNEVEQRMPPLSIGDEIDLIEYISQPSLLKFTSRPFKMFSVLKSYKNALEEITERFYDNQANPIPRLREDTLCAKCRQGNREEMDLWESVELLLPRMIDPCFLGKLMSSAASEKGHDQDQDPFPLIEELNDFCRVYCEFLTTSLDVMERSAPSGCSYLTGGGSCEDNKCFCSRDFPIPLQVARLCYPSKVPKRRMPVMMLSCHNKIRIKLLRKSEISQFVSIQESQYLLELEKLEAKLGDKRRVPKVDT